MCLAWVVDLGVGARILRPLERLRVHHPARRKMNQRVWAGEGDMGGATTNLKEELGDPHPIRVITMPWRLDDRGGGWGGEGTREIRMPSS